MAQSASTVGSNIPQVWEADLLRAREKMLSFAQGCTRKFEDRLLRGGDSIRITTVGDITINTSHSRTADMSLQNLRTTDQTLVIDREDDFAFYLDDVDEVQALSDIMAECARRAAYATRNTMDTYIAAAMAAGVSSGNVLTAAVVGTGATDADAFELLVDIAVKLDENNAPEDSRFVFIPPWYAGVLMKDPRRTSFGTSDNLKAYGSGYLGRTVEGLEVFKSNNVPLSGTTYTVIGGTRDATALCEQINKYENNRHPTRIGDIHKGLHVYGAKVVRPDELVSVAVTQAVASTGS